MASIIGLGGIDLWSQLLSRLSWEDQPGLQNEFKAILVNLVRYSLQRQPKGGAEIAG